MPTHSDDRLLWLFTGLGLFIAVKVIPGKLRYIRYLTEVSGDDEAEEESARLNEDAEHALKLETLQTLALGRNYDIHKCALKILVEQCTKSPLHDLLLRDLASHDPLTRGKAVNTLLLLLRHASVKRYVHETMDLLQTEKAWRAIVSALVNLLPDHAWSQVGSERSLKGKHMRSPVAPPFRPPQESKMLDLVYRLLCGEPNIDAVISAGLISRWLKVYPFPCKLIRSGGGSPDVIALLMNDTWGDDDEIMTAIVVKLTLHQKGVDELRQCGLTRASSAAALHPNTFPNYEEPIDNDVVMTGGEDTAGIVIPNHTLDVADQRPGSSWSRQPPNRQLSNQELQRRRRRREAMVLSDGDEPLTQGNILQRDNSHAALAPRRTTEADQQVAQMIEQIERADQGGADMIISRDYDDTRAAASFSEIAGELGRELEAGEEGAVAAQEDYSTVAATSGGGDGWMSGMRAWVYGLTTRSEPQRQPLADITSRSNIGSAGAHD